MYCSQECRLRDHHNQLPPSLHIHQQFSSDGTTTTSRSSTASPSPNQSPNFLPYGSGNTSSSSTPALDCFSSQKPSPSSPHRSNSMTNRRMSAWYGGTMTSPPSQQLLPLTMMTTTTTLPQQQFTYELRLCKCKSPTCKHKQKLPPTQSGGFYESRSRARTLCD